MIRLLALAPVLALAACAPPVPMDAAEADRVCRAEIARNSTVRPRVGVVIGSGGPRIRTGVTVPSGAFDARPYEQRLAECVTRRMTGQGPAPTFGVGVGTSARL